MSLGSIRNLDHVVLLCQDLAATRTFYADVMRFALEEDRSNWVSFRVGSGLLTLRPRGERRGMPDGPVPDGSASVQLAFRVPPAAVEECHTALLAHGVSILSAPTELPGWRHRTLFFRDPEGNLIEIYAEI